jgi:hypothetical protein
MQYLVFLTKEFLLRTFTLLLLFDFEVGLIKLIQTQSTRLGKINFGARCDNVCRIDPPKRHTIDFERSRYENSIVDLLEHNNAFATITASKDNTHRSGCQLGHVSVKWGK